MRKKNDFTEINANGSFECSVAKTEQYEEMTKDELIQSCKEKDCTIRECMKQIERVDSPILSKSDIMRLYNCESNKALRILKLLFQMGKGNKVGKEYYVTRENHNEFMYNFQGKEVFV